MLGLSLLMLWRSLSWEWEENCGILSQEISRNDPLTGTFMRYLAAISEELVLLLNAFEIGDSEYSAKGYDGREHEYKRVKISRLSLRCLSSHLTSCKRMRDVKKVLCILREQVRDRTHIM